MRELCRRLEVPLIAGGADVGPIARERRWNLEDAARRLRYDFLRRAAKQSGCEAVLVAHTLDDQAETFLLQALRGSALPAGMLDGARVRCRCGWTYDLASGEVAGVARLGVDAYPVILDGDEVVVTIPRA